MASSIEPQKGIMWVDVETDSFVDFLDFLVFLTVFSSVDKFSTGIEVFLLVLTDYLDSIFFLPVDLDFVVPDSTLDIIYWAFEPFDFLLLVVFVVISLTGDGEAFPEDLASIEESSSEDSKFF